MRKDIQCKTTTFIPSPGIVIILPFEADKNSFTITNAPSSRLLKGKVIQMGINLITDLGALLEGNRYCSVGDTVYFLSYEGNYDNFIEDGQKYYAVKLQDLRCVIK